MTKIKLRDYQRESIDSLHKWFSEHKEPLDSPLVSIPTGGGKSLTIAALISEALQQWPKQRFLVLSHVGEILKQNHQALMDYWPHADTGIYSAGLGHKDKKASVTFASIQSIHKHAFNFDPWDIIIIDECHLLSPKGGTMYRRFIKDAKLANPNLRIIGYTATPFRLDCGLLTDGDNRLFTHIAYDLPITRLIKEGHLVPLITKGGIQKVDLKDVRKQGGDYKKTDLERAFYDDNLTNNALDEVEAYGKDRKTWLIFAVSIKHGEDITDNLNNRGITTELIHGGTPKDERTRILTEFKSMKIKAVVSVEVMTTGVNIPNIDLLVFLRSTMSVSLYIQMSGRAMRLSPETGKKDALVLDFANLIETHGPIDTIEVRSKKQKGEGATKNQPTKECPDCRAILSIFAKTCEQCGHEFESKPFHDAVATEAAILSTQQKPESFHVQSVSYATHCKPGKPDSIRVDYICGLKIHSEWICPEHMGYAQTKAVQWWGNRSPAMIPATTDLCLDYIKNHGIKEPSSIWVKKNGKYKEITGYEFESSTTGANDLASRGINKVSQDYPSQGALL